MTNYQTPPATYSIPPGGHSTNEATQRTFESGADVYEDLKDFAEASHAALDDETI